MNLLFYDPEVTQFSLRIVQGIMCGFLPIALRGARNDLKIMISSDTRVVLKVF